MSAAGADAVTTIAKEAGFAITAEDIQSMQSSTDISDDELEGVAGGGWEEDFLKFNSKLMMCDRPRKWTSGPRC